MIEIKGIRFKVEIERKWIKNMYLRIKGDTIYVSAPKLTPDHLVYRFIESKRSWIYDAYTRLNEREMNSRTYHGGDVFYLFDEPYRLVYQESARKSVQIKDHTIYLHGREDDRENALKYLYKQLDKQLLEQAERYLQDYRESILISYGYQQMPELRARPMTSRWGVCYTRKNRISINSYLIHYPLECLEYIMVHEMTHFIIPNHSKRFYQIVGSNLPDYKQIRKKLRG